nr:hypothetical protein [uncultured Rhodococcus sp.]
MSGEMSTVPWKEVRGLRECVRDLDTAFFAAIEAEVPNAERDARQRLLKLRRRLRRDEEPLDAAQVEAIRKGFSDALLVHFDELHAARERLACAKLRVSQLDADFPVRLGRLIPALQQDYAFRDGLLLASQDMHDRLMSENTMVNSNRGRKLARTVAGYLQRAVYGTVPFGEFSVIEAEFIDRTSTTRINLGLIAANYSKLAAAAGPSTLVSRAARLSSRTGFAYYWRTNLRGGVVAGEPASLPLHHGPVSAIEDLLADSALIRLEDLVALLGSHCAQPEMVARRFLSNGFLVIPGLLDYSRADDPGAAIGAVLTTLDPSSPTVQAVSALIEVENRLRATSDNSLSEVTAEVCRAADGLDWPLHGATAPLYRDRVVPAAGPTAHSAAAPPLKELAILNRLFVTHGISAPIQDALHDFLTARTSLESNPEEALLEFATDQLPGLLARVDGGDLVGDGGPFSVQSFQQYRGRRGGVAVLQAASHGLRDMPVVGNHFCRELPNGGTLWDHCYGGRGFSDSRFVELVDTGDVQGALGDFEFVQLVGGPNVLNIQRRSALAGLRTLSAGGDHPTQALLKGGTIGLADTRIEICSGRPILRERASGRVLLPTYPGYLGRRFLPPMTRTLLLFGATPEQSWASFSEVAVKLTEAGPLGIGIRPAITFGALTVHPRSFSVPQELLPASGFGELLEALDQIVMEVGMPNVVRYDTEAPADPASKWRALSEMHALDLDSEPSIRLFQHWLSRNRHSHVLFFDCADDSPEVREHVFTVTSPAEAR